MGFSFLALALFRNRLPDAPWRPLVAGLGYSVGFVIVILGCQQLFTESTLTAVLPLLTRRDARTLMTTLRLRAIVLAANLLGTLLFAAVISRPGIFRPELFHALEDVAQEALDGTFWPVLVRSVFAGWLIALMVWLLPGAHSARLFVIIVLTYVVSLAQLSHVVAGSAEAAFAVFTSHAAVGDYILGFMVPTLIGNTIGGVSLVALLNHAPHAPKMQDAKAGE